MSLDLTSALFLAPGPCVRGIGRPALGRPAVIAEPAEYRRLARHLSAAHGAEDGLFARSSFHGLLDAISCALPSLRSAVVMVDEYAYPVAHWAATAASNGPRGAHPTIMTFRHLDSADAQRLARATQRPVVIVTDGLCGSCLRPAPLSGLSAAARCGSGLVVVDDTLAAGVLGRRTPTSGPFGLGGAGTAAWLGVPATDLVVVASLAKGYGVPLALVAGPSEVVDRVRGRGPARVHASSPSRTDVAAVSRLALPEELARRRERLSRLVRHARTRVRRIGLMPRGIPFPVLHLDGLVSPTEVADSLSGDSIRVLVTAGSCTGRPALTICLRADLTEQDVDVLLDTLTAAVCGRAA